MVLKPFIERPFKRAGLPSYYTLSTRPPAFCEGQVKLSDKDNNENLYETTA